MGMAQLAVPFGMGDQDPRKMPDERWWVDTAVVGPRAGHGVRWRWPCPARRDFDAGILPQRPGQPAPRACCRPLGLVFRLQRASLIGWTVGIAIMGLVMGLIADEAQTLAENIR